MAAPLLFQSEVVRLRWLRLQPPVTFLHIDIRPGDSLGNRRLSARPHPGIALRPRRALSYIATDLALFEIANRTLAPKAV
jgi:hypothetical protein